MTGMEIKLKNILLKPVRALHFCAFELKWENLGKCRGHFYIN